MEYKLSSFQFGDDISRDDKHHAIMSVNALRSACPSDATFSGHFNWDGQSSFTGHLRVLFAKGEFAATVSGSSMEHLMERVRDEIKKQIEVWRETRFDQEDTFVDFSDKVKKGG